MKKRDVTSIKGIVYPGVMKEPFEEPFLSEFIYSVLLISMTLILLKYRC